MKHFSQHTSFFSSLKQVEKRLKLEDKSPPPPLEQPEINNTSPESLGTPMYLNFDQSINATSSTLSDSEPPQEFISQFSLTQQQQSPSRINAPDHRDDIQRLIQLLGLSDDEEDREEEEEERVKRGGCGNSCDCEDGFYDKIVGVKGPKCKKEVERLEGWIKHFANDGGEPLRLAHLLLGKAVFHSSQHCGVFGGLEFPSTIVEFLEIDKDSNKIEELKRDN